MNVQVSGHHVEVTQPIHDYVLAKLERVQRHFDHVIDINVILSVQKLRQKAEISVHLRGKDIHVESDDEDLYAAIDLMMDKLDRQIIKHKQKAYSHPHDALKRQAADEYPGLRVCWHSAHERGGCLQTPGIAVEWRAFRHPPPDPGVPETRLSLL